MLTLKLHYIIRINKRTLPCIALSLYLLQEMIYAIFSIAFGGGGTARIFTIIVMYLPLIAMLFFQSDTIIYELHVRGFTKDASSKVKAPGTFAGLIEKIPYLLELGITTIELMPVFEFDEMRDCRLLDENELLDYWGYNPVSFFAPNTSYASTSEYNREGNELKCLIRECHAHGRIAHP